jgi:ParB family transcriptional regulator, chromosome partitioning protein
VRSLAAEALGRHSPQRAARLAGPLLSDRVSFNRLAGGNEARVADTVRAAAAQVHYQGVALPHLIARSDLQGLAAVAQDRQLPEATRLGAVEGLAVLATEAAEAMLRAIGEAEKENEELRKAAWRGLRRSKRARRRPQMTAEGG